MEEIKGMQLALDLDESLREFFKGTVRTPLSCSTCRIEEAKKNWVKVSAEITEETKNPYGMIHGGVIFVLCDYCAGYTALAAGKKTVTLNSTINYIKGARKGHIYAVPTIIHQGKSTLVIEVTVTDDDENLIAKASFTMFAIGDLPKLEG